uniref:glucose-6-phosphatase n=1 Tax=Timema cristinae TaxID=61476 RepID=A0A7R9D612_TIMCR|nr:unnamed protein product [Timema cristinae]
MRLIEELNTLGVSGITLLQSNFPKSDGFFLTVTQLADPLYAFLFLVPIAAGLHTSFGTDILVATVVAEWSNTLLKWLLMEDRPFWWVRETDVYGKGDLARFPKLRQTPLTCETGPGSPSGHVMGYGAVAYCLVVWFIKMFVKNNKKLSARTKSRVIVSVWILYAVTIVLVALSRLYVATHFPHQCLLGALGVFHLRPHSSKLREQCGRKRNVETLKTCSGRQSQSPQRNWPQNKQLKLVQTRDALNQLRIRLFIEQCGRKRNVETLKTCSGRQSQSPQRNWPQNKQLKLVQTRDALNQLRIRLFMFYDHPIHTFSSVCVCVCVGVLVAWVFTSPQSWVCRWWSRSSRPILILAALFTTLLSVGAYWLQRLLGVDPQWSIKLAFKWCESPDFLHVNTTPLFSLVRSCGALLGIALATPLVARLVYLNSSFNALSQTFYSKIGIVVTTLCLLTQRPALGIWPDLVYATTRQSAWCVLFFLAGRSNWPPKLYRQVTLKYSICASSFFTLSSRTYFLLLSRDFAVLASPN